MERHSIEKSPAFNGDLHDRHGKTYTADDGNE
jgi:hypothetical protein